MRYSTCVAAVLCAAMVATAAPPGMQFSNGGNQITAFSPVSNPFATGADFLWDDGTGEASIGVNNGVTGTTFGWSNRFQNNSGAPIVIANIEVAFGRIAGLPGDPLEGDAVDAVLYRGGTGTLQSATFDRRWTLPGGIHSGDGMTFANHNVPGGAFVVNPGEFFFVGLGDIQTQNDSIIRFPAAQDTTAPHTSNVSWAHFGPATYDPQNLGAQTVGTIESFGLPGNWLVRANIIPEPATLSLLVFGGLALVRRRR